MTPLIDQAGIFVHDTPTLHTGNRHLALESVALTMGTQLTLAAVITRLFDFVLLWMCQERCDADIQVRRIVVGVALHQALALFGENAEFFRAIGEIIEKCLPGLSDGCTELPGFD